MKKTKLILSILASTIIASQVAVASAVQMISFDDDSIVQTGTVNYVAGSTLSGTDILFSSVIGLNTPMNDGTVLTLENGKLNFVTGPNAGTIGDVTTFSGGGYFTIRGDLYKNGATLVNTSSDLLVEGTFSEATLTEFFDGTSLAFVSAGTDVKNQDLVDFYGVNADTFSFVSSQLSLLGVTPDGNGGFTAKVSNADFDNSPAVSDESSTVALLGLGLAGLGAIARRRK